MSGAIKDLAKEKLESKLQTVSIYKRKQLWMSLIVIASAYYGFCRAPDNCGSPGTIGLLSTVSRAVISLGFHIAFDLKAPGIGYPLMKSINKVTTNVQPNVEHFVIDQIEYKLHVFKPYNIEGTSGALVSLHQGGWTVGSVPMHFQFYSNMALHTKTYVFAPEYRLAPEYLYPAAFEDCVDAIEYVFENAEKYNIDENNIVITGDSAGGQMSFTTAILMQQNGYNIKGIVPVYPLTQGVYMKTPSYTTRDNFILSGYHGAAFLSTYIFGSDHVVEKLTTNEIINSALTYDIEIAEIFALADIELDKSDSSPVPLSDDEELLLDWRISPLLAEPDDIRLLPKAVIYVCEHDVLRDDGFLMYKRMKSLGADVEFVEWEGAVHGHFLFSAQYAPWGALGYDLVPNATKHIQNYFDTLVALLS